MKSTLNRKKINFAKPNQTNSVAGDDLCESFYSE